MTSLRIVGVSPAPDVSDWREPRPEGKWSQFFGALAARADVIDVVSPQLSRRDTYINLLRWAAPGRERWLARAGFNQSFVAKVNAALERELVARGDGCDLIVQMQTLCSPRSSSVRTPYVIYTDNTMALTQRHRPASALIPPRMLRQWLDFETRVCRDAQAVFTFSEFARASVLEDYGCAPEQVRAVGTGANQLLPEPAPAPSGPPRVLFIGREFERKGGRVLLEAWRAVHARHPEAELLIVGPRQDPAPGAGLGVRYLGRLSRVQLAERYLSASVFVLPSLFEPWGFVFIEAMGYGLPCVGADCCAMPEIIDAGVTGLLAAPGDAPELAEAILALLDDPARARTMGRAGHAKALEHYSWARVADRVLGQVEALGAAEPAER
jgi:glycosyltransferase involved in cell wall biosynthesis